MITISSATHCRVMLAALLVATFIATANSQERPVPDAQTAGHAGQHRWALVMHGGAGVIERSAMTSEADAGYRAGMKQAAEAAEAILNRGGSAIDAVEAAIRLLEDNPLFNAGKGAVFTYDGKVELDASIMDGRTMQAGAVANVRTVRHPISLARAVMEHSPHVMLAGAGADAFAAQEHLEIVPQNYFFTERRWQSLLKQLNKEHAPIPPRPDGAPPPPDKPVAEFEPADAHKYGTVGVVALDHDGNVAAGTSTGGTQAKRWDRIGDSPIIGAGTYASNESCGVSATGDGEYFIRLTVARTICALVQYRGMSVQAAADQVVQKDLVAIHGGGGVVALAPDGQIAWSFNTPGMYRARWREGDQLQIGIYKDEP